MEEEKDEAPGLVDALFNQLGLGPIVISQLVNGVIREEVIRSLIKAGIMTNDQFSAALDRALREANELCDHVELTNQIAESREVLQNMRDSAQQIVDGLRKDITEQPSQPSQQA
jgi:hypothetical protein